VRIRESRHAELAQLTAEAYRILKAVDPANTVFSPAVYAPGYPDQLLQLGMASNVDMIAYHLYTPPPEATAAAIANVRLVMAEHGVGAVPLWDTEGASGDTTVPEDLAAAYLVRKYLVDLAFGSVHAPATGVIVWNPTATVPFAVPAATRTLCDIFGGVTPVTASTVSVGYAPVLLFSGRGAIRGIAPIGGR